MAELNCRGGMSVVSSDYENNDKAKPAERRGRKATGPRFLREAKDDSPKNPAIMAFLASMPCEGN
jgi:hypothetical protein